MQVYAGTERDVLDWRGKIENLRSRTTTSLAVMTCIEGLHTHTHRV